MLLISGIFVMLTASLDPKILIEIFNPAILAYVAAMLFIVRPLSIWISTIGTELNVREKLLIGWIAPRGIVALTVSGYFAAILLENGYKDANIRGEGAVLELDLEMNNEAFHQFLTQ